MTTPEREHERASQPVRESIARRLRLAQMLGQTSTGLVAAASIAALSAGLLPAAFILAGGELASAIEQAIRSPGNRDLSDVTRAFTVLVALFLMSEVMVPVQARLRWLVGKRVDGAVRRRAIRAALTGTDMSHLHDEDMLRGLRRVDGMVHHAATPGSGAAGLIGVTRDYVAGLTAAAIVVWFDVPIGLLIVVAALILRLLWRREVIAIIDAWIDGLDAMGEAGYFVELGLGRHAALEVRLFGLRDWISRRIEAAGIRGWTPTWRSRSVHLGRMSALHLVVTVVVAIVALVWAANGTVAGTMTIAEVVVFVPAVFAALGLARVFDDDTAVEYGTVTLPGLEAVERGAARAIEHGAGRHRPDADRAPTIALRGVTFRYPESEAAVLRDVDLTIPSGTSASLVGLNGAGKTTLVRLLCGLYTPDQGTVLVDGTDLRDVDLQAWHARIAPMFQEFVRLQVGIRENVTAGAAWRPPDDDAVRAALANADALPFVERLPDGTATVLATKHAEGADLSGGQWQRLGVARAMYALDAGARFLILDEPTSNLDTSSEERVVERLVEATRGEVTTLLVTHRLSLARRTDRIFVLDGGQIAEAGAHDELVALGGRYADAFGMQAAMYPLEPSDA